PMPGDNVSPIRNTNVDGQFGEPPTASHSLGRRAWLIGRTIQARLRFVVILAAIGLVIANWNWLTAVWEKWTRPTDDAQAASDTEYYCPMHPQIVRDRSDKCPICGMPLSAHKKGEQAEGEALPPGVRRVQLSPYRVVLAGLKTAEVTYRQLRREVRAVGFV